ncbi:response regulator [Plectonema cf. radiosum LEGE 06105]|uniref:Response regulator n=1 Tax=Plectonema cf. radiosum LEGE 06105 TaxID=945769 RepID=A0A8J7F5A9_9CYAN|nr:response regulator [Plectonema radiosum]MBE9215582.1 response regulator [Plectonema cf. radiosum LEGE 06105]
MKEILIVEDENRLAAFLQKGLRKNGYSTVIAEDGEQAISIALNKQFDLMVLDIGLPFKDGFTVLQELRTQGRKLPVIVITARSDDEDKTKAFASGANDYMKKPFRFQDLLASVNQHLILVKS